MDDKHISVEKFYSKNHLYDEICKIIKEKIKTEKLSDFSALDEFHIRGLKATKELSSLIEIKSNYNILDLGCGLGGSSRYLASTFNCNVQGVDLSEDYCKIATFLSKQLNLEGKTSFLSANALQLPFTNNYFDIVWTEHVQMNIKNKNIFYNEINRVLKPGGLLLFHDVFKGENSNVEFPLPWANSHSMNYLVDENNLINILKVNEFHIKRNINVSSESLIWYEKVIKKINPEKLPSIGLHLLMGKHYFLKLKNTLSNLKKGSIIVLMGVVEKNKIYY